MKASNFYFFCIVFFIFFCNFAKGFEIPTPPSINVSENKTLPELYTYLEKEAKKLMNQIIKMALPSVMQYSDKINVSAECMKDAMHIMFGIRNLKDWAIQFIDASGKLPDGVMSGAITTVGAYDECMDINVRSTKGKNEGKTLFVGQYCLLEATLKSLHIKTLPAHRMFMYPEELKEILASDTIGGFLAQQLFNMKIGGPRIAICIPSGCNKEDIYSVIRTFTDEYPVNVTVLSCEVKEENEYTISVILVIALYSFITLVVLASSIMDYYSVWFKVTFESTAIRYFLAFSLYTNFRKIYAVRSQSNNMHCLYGINFFGIIWLFLGHTVLFQLSPLSYDLYKIRGYTQELSFQVITNAALSVDTIFFTGSFLVSYLTIKLCKVEGKSFNAWMYIIHRLWRIYPAYLLSLTISAIIPLMGSGPNWTETTGKMLKYCYDNWWASMFFVNNIYKPTESCWSHTWYITVDMQLHFLAIIFIVPLIKWPKIGISMIFLGITSSILWCGIATYVNDYPPTVLLSLMDKEEMINYLYSFYYAPMTHLGPYALGILVGYIYAVNPNYKMSRMVLAVGWCFASICCLCALYGSIGWYRGEMPYYLLIMYASFCRISWQVGVAWMVFACITGNGGYINTILSWRMFVPLGRLSYCAYLLHYIVMLVFYGSFKTRLQPDVYIQIWLWLGHVSASYGLAVILFLFVEVPFRNMEHILFFERQKELEDFHKEKTIVAEGLETMKEKSDIIIITPHNNEAFNKI